MTVGQAQQLLADYDKRNNAAIKAANPPTFDTSVWKKADTGPVLESDEYWTRHEQLGPKGEQEAGPPLRTTALEVLGPVRHRDGAVAFVRVEARGREETGSSTSAADEDDSWMVMVRKSSKAPWLLWNEIPALAGTMPDPLPASTDPTPTPQQVDRSQSLVQALIDGLRQEPSSPFHDHDIVRRQLNRALGGSAKGASRTVACEPYAAPGSEETGNALILGQAEKAVVNAVSISCRIDATAPDGQYFDLARATREIDGITEKYPTQAVVNYAISGLIVQPKGGEPKLVGMRMDEVGPD